MSTIKIEFPAGDSAASNAFSAALAEYSLFLTCSAGEGEQPRDLQLTNRNTGETLTAVAKQSDTPSPSPLAGVEKDLEAETAEAAPLPAPSGKETAPSATEPTGSGEGSASAAGVSETVAEARVDNKGVVFDAEFCGEAKVPFYGSGKREGQWKKRKGVTEEAYDAWYEGALPVEPEPPATPEETPAAPAAPAAPAPSAPANPAAPTTAGEFFAWTAQRQAAGLMTAEDLSAAYAQLGLDANALFPPTPPEEVAARIAKLLVILDV